MSRRRRRRRGTGSGSLLGSIGKIAIVAATAILVLSLVFPSFGFTTAVSPRGADVGAAEDSNALLGIDVNEQVTAGERSRLVTVTNQLGEQATVTLELRDAGDGSLDGGSGGTIEFTLDGSESKRVYIVAGDSSCSGGPTSESTDAFRVTFICSEYDPDDDETTYKYFVEGIGEDSSEYKDLSHAVFGVPDGFDEGQVVSTSPSGSSEVMFGAGDPTTGVSGVKWDEQVSKVDDACDDSDDSDDGDGGDDDCDEDDDGYVADDDSEQRFTYTLDGRYGRETVDVGLKLGPDERILDLPGPSLSSPSGGADSEITFEVTAVTTGGESTVTLSRSTEVVSDDGDDATATATATEDGDDGDDGDDGSDDGDDGDDGSEDGSDESEDSDDGGDDEDGGTGNGNGKGDGNGDERGGNEDDTEDDDGD